MDKELSIIVPVLNEADTIGRLFRNLAAQYGVDFELIISDGGSTDATLERANRHARDFAHPVQVISGAKGRGRQMNAGARAATGESLLFIHADSSFNDERALRKALDQLDNAIAARGDDRIAGHFSLVFDSENKAPVFYFYESKARLHRAGCIHGDQGFLMRRGFFTTVGPFDESLPFLEDVRLAEAISRQGEWLLFPAEIYSSTRRFDVEGLLRRQILNAIIMALSATGRDEFLAELPSIYRLQENTANLKLHPILRRIKELIQALPIKERTSFWRATGEYVRCNAWQVAFGMDAHRNFRMGQPLGKGDLKLLDFYDRRLERLFSTLPGRFAVTAAVFCWFRMICLAAFLREYELVA